MNTVTIDTHAYFKQLIAAGLPEEQAEIIAQRETVRNEEFATKNDILLLKKDIENLEYRLTIKFGVMLVAGLATTIGIILAILPILLR